MSLNIEFVFRHHLWLKMSFTTDDERKIQYNEVVDELDLRRPLSDFIRSQRRDYVVICNLRLSLGKCWIPGDEGVPHEDNLIHRVNNTLSIINGHEDDERDVIHSQRIDGDIQRSPSGKVYVLLNQDFRLQVDVNKALIIHINEFEGNINGSFTYSFDLE